MVVVERFRPLCVAFPPIAPMPLKIAPKGEISPTLRTGVMNWGDVFRGRVHIIRKTNTVDFAYSDFDYNDSSPDCFSSAPAEYCVFL